MSLAIAAISAAVTKTSPGAPPQQRTHPDWHVNLTPSSNQLVFMKAGAQGPGVRGQGSEVGVLQRVWALQLLALQEVRLSSPPIGTSRWRSPFRWSSWV